MISYSARFQMGASAQSNRLPVPRRPQPGPAGPRGNSESTGPADSDRTRTVTVTASDTRRPGPGSSWHDAMMALRQGLTESGWQSDTVAVTVTGCRARARP